MKSVILLILVLIFIYYTNYLNYWKMIWFNSRKRDYVKWKLCDKYTAKFFAKKNGFNVPKLIQYVKFPHQFKEPKFKQYVIKPVDLCDSSGVYLMKNGINLIDNKKYSFFEIQKNLVKLRSQIKQEYYMYTNMYNYKVPNTGYIMEELLLENNEIPYDYKCYVFNGKIYFIAKTFNRRIEKGEQKFDSVWLTKKWKPIPFKMIKKGYKYKKIPKPEGLENMIKQVEFIGKKLNRHCRIDVYLIKGKIYFGEFTFFGGAFLHTRLCNNILGLLWNIFPDKVNN